MTLLGDLVAEVTATAIWPTFQQALTLQSCQIAVEGTEIGSGLKFSPDLVGRQKGFGPGENQQHG
jgi:hypothetical protein